ncbi:Adenylylsulfate reductase membrane anchor [uncultured Gammaproteobacteria bacterium]|nr:Adenylylsulfate reductase membrane anchor [Bathymodiolus brooksi thiotrophic gill symbiont]CAC9616910.1 Adenylylsulfate reductase membrane anchor [uncultured Gammaproteobacteria bacterium]CAC9617559.1 Adenylylsulfate reductase membrane anchor [uncultured Gammaproteobacteria bacterium]
MITNTPIALLEATTNITYTDMQTYAIIMVALVIVMTVMDMLHKKSAKYFFENASKAKKNATKELTAGDKVGIAVATIATDVISAGEFNNPVRRLVHLLTMYGFILFNASTAMMIFGQSGDNVTLTLIWHIGAIMLFVGSFWFWFCFKVDVAAEGNSPFNIDLRRDAFSLSLMATSVSALIWSFNSNSMGWEFAFVILATASLFGGVYWSKFSHMFFKPFAAYDKRITKADGSAENLPTLTRDEPEQQKRHSMELLVDAPMDMGLGIKRETPNHY